MSDIKFRMIKDFSRYPGARYYTDGSWSGEEFREKHLSTLIKKAITDDVTLVIDLDGAAGYATSFLEEAFGGLIRKEGLLKEDVFAHLEVITKQEPYLWDEIKEYIDNAVPQP